MKRHVIYGNYGENDLFEVIAGIDEVITTVPLLDTAGCYSFGINSALEDLLKFDMKPTDIGIDLLILAVHVQVADTRISRERESQDSWTREIRLVVPVSDINLWNKTNKTLVRMLNFLTGDLWTIQFRIRPDDHKINLPANTLELQNPIFNTVSLFSGGLDSYIGAVDMLEHKLVPLLISHASDGATSGTQKQCFNMLKEEYPKSPFNRLRLWMDVSEIKIGSGESEKSTRGRSFLFFAIGVFAGTGLGKPFALQIPENGLIALNAPLDQLRLGSHTTHTTHPFYVARWNDLLNILGFNAKVQNPFWKMTKGEMIKASKNRAFLARTMAHTLSCSSPTKSRWKGGNERHCGYCLPCLIRRAAIDYGAGKGADKTEYTIDNLRDHPLNSKRAEGVQIRSVQHALNMLKNHPEISSTIIHKPGPLSDLTVEEQGDLSNVYNRGLNEVGSILDGVETKPL